MPDKITYNKKDLKALIKKVHSGEVNPEHPPKDLYFAIIKLLSDAAARGIGTFKNKTPEIDDLMEHFDYNIAVFSAAKVHQEVVDMGREIFDPETGFKRSFREFEEKAKGIFDTYQKHHLKVEYRTAVNVAYSARKWLIFKENEDLFPLLRYETTPDDRVRLEHVELDFITLPIFHPFWLEFWPPNGWNCRCDVTAHAYEDHKWTDVKTLKNLTKPDELFRFNAGIDKIIFDEKHPHLSLVAERYKVARGHNFNLPLPKRPKGLSKKPKKAEVIEIIHPMQPDGFKELAGVKMPDGFFDLFTTKVSLGRSRGRKGSHHLFDPETELSKINISKATKKGSPRMARVLTHEFGHAFHSQHGFIRRREPVDVDFEKMFTAQREKITGQGLPAKERLALEKKVLQYFKFNHKKGEWILTPEQEDYILPLLEKIAKDAGVLSGTDIERGMRGSLFDVIGSLTNGVFGYGHSPVYYKSGRGYGGRVELMAAAFEHKYFHHNIYIEHFFPELAVEMSDIIDKLIAKIPKP